MSRRRTTRMVIGCVATLALTWPAVSPADHVSVTGSVSALLKERSSSLSWVVEVAWNSTCPGAAPGRENYTGSLNLIDLDTGERIYLGGVSSASGTSRQLVETRERERRVMPELKIGCFEDGSVHGGGPLVVTGNTVIVPPRFGDSPPGGGGGGGGGSPPGGAGGDYGSGGDPTEALGSDGCKAAQQGTSGPDTLLGTPAGDVIFGYDGDDRIHGAGGYDCLLGGKGRDVLEGGAAADVLTGGRGDDRLDGGSGTNSYDAGPGADRIDARNGRRELVRCGGGRDRARVDRRDRVRSCERLTFR